ncbi:MAG: hypothetical protein V4550_05130 [Gemmatimonadota bacterium]
MNSRNRRLAALVCAVVGSALLQACANVTTGSFRATQSRKMSSFDMLHYQATPGVSRLMMTTQGTGGLWDYKYY